MLNRANLKTAATLASSVISFPPNTAQRWTLPNGLTIIVQEDHSAPVASVQAWCATGSIYEDQHLGAGLSHILEHMLFKGTSTRSTNQIAQTVQDVGGYINAYTSFDRTVFWIDVPKEGALTALDILADAMMNSTLPPQEYVKEQEVIRREFAMGMDDPDRTMTHLLFATAYQRHPYRLSVILGEGHSSRLYRKVREESGLAFSISAFSYTPGDPGILGVDAILDPKNRSAAQSLILQIIEDIRRDGVSAEELAKGKKIALSQELASLRTMRGQATDLGTNWFLTRNLNFGREYLEKVQKVTLDDIKRVAIQYLSEENLTVVSLNPKGSLVSKSALSAPVAIGEIQKFELSNGLRILVREDARLPLVAMSAIFRCGLLSETEANNGITRLAAKTLLKGTKTRSAEQIAHQLEAVGGEITAQAGNNSFAVNLDITQPDLALGTDILADVLLNATMPAKAVAREKEIQLAKIKDEDETPTSVARNLLKRARLPGQPLALRQEGRTESESPLNSKQLEADRERYDVARNGVIAVFGNVKANEVRDLFEQKLGALPSGEL